MSKRLKVLFRTKGGHKEGMGDIVSSLALAEEFSKQGHEPLFVINNDRDTIAAISQKKFEYKTGDSLKETEECLNGEPIDIAILTQLNTPEEEGLIFKFNFSTSSS